MMAKRRHMSRWLIVFVLVGILGFLVPIDTYEVIVPGAQAIWNQDQLYIFVAQNKLGWSRNLWTFTWQTARAAVGLASPPTFKRIDCLVYRVSSTTSDKHVVKGLESGIFVPYKGSIYTLIGGKTPRTLRWDGERFISVPAEEAAGVGGSFTYSNELFKREGWSHTDLLPVRGSADHQLIFGGVARTIRATQSSDGMSTIELINSNDPKDTEVVYRVKNESGFLSATNYKQFVN